MRGKPHFQTDGCDSCSDRTRNESDQTKAARKLASDAKRALAAAAQMIAGRCNGRPHLTGEEFSIRRTVGSELKVLS